MLPEFVISFMIISCIFLPSVNKRFQGSLGAVRVLRNKAYVHPDNFIRFKGLLFRLKS